MLSITSRVNRETFVPMIQAGIRLLVVDYFSKFAIFYIRGERTQFVIIVVRTPVSTIITIARRGNTTVTATMGLVPRSPARRIAPPSRT